MDINKSRKGISVCASANEVDEAVRQERHKWKIFRIQQVREQARQEARRIRESVRDKELQMVRDLRQELNDQWQAEKENEVQQLQQEYKESLEALGEAHEVAKQQPNASEVLNQLARCNQQKAKRRGQEAQKVQTDQQLQQQHEKTKLLKQRQDVLNREKLRANLIANLPTPEAFKKKTYVVEKKTPAVQFHEAGTFTTTTYVPKNVIIEKEVNSTKPNAKQAAVVEEMAQAVLAEAKCKAAEEEDRKREKRGNEALSRERLRRMYQQLMRQLDQAQRDHQLSSYLKGADSLSIYETEETRLKHHAKLQRLMEKAVGKVLQEEDALQAEDVSSDDTQPAVESSGLSEVTDTSSVMSAQKTSSKKVKDLKSLLDQIKKRRNEILQGVYSSVPEEEEASEKEVIDEAEDKYMRQYTRQEEVESDAQYLQTQITAQDDDDGGMTPNGEDHQQQDQQYGGSKRRGEEKDIHMAATIPVHLLPGTHDGKSICTSKRIVTELPSTKSSLEKSGSDDIERQVNIDEDVSTVGAQTSADEYSRLPSPIVYSLPRDKDLVSSISSGTSSTDYLCPPSSLPFRIPLAKKTMDSLRETQPQRQYVSSRPISKEHEDIHLADTVPVHLLPTHHYNGSTDSSQRFASQLSTLSSNQESSSDDIEIKIKIRGDGSTLKTITPSEDEVPEPVSFIADHEHPMEYSYSGTSSTEYISPPSSLPARNIQTSQLNENLRKIQQQRHKIQHIIDSKSDRSTRQTSLQKSISPSVYYEKLKGEGIGKRPLKKKEKFEMQKKEVLNYYMKKLLQMKGGELKNISASTVEGSGFNVSSLSSFLESLQREKGPSVFNTSSSDSPLSSAHESSIDSNSFSSYYDIDEIPVKLSSHSSSDSIYSYDKGTDTHSNPSERYRIQQSSALTQSYDDESRKPEHPVYSQSNASLNSNIAKPFPHSSVSLGSQSDESNSGIISGGPTDLRRELQVLDSIKNLEQLKKELMNLQHQVFEENLSATKPDSSNSSLSNRSEATYPTVSSDVRQPRKVTFGSTHQKVGLSTIYEASSDLSESHLNISGSTSYQTPSREYESSLDDAESQISLLQQQDSEAFHIPQGTRPQNKIFVSEEATADGHGKKLFQRNTHMTFQTEFKHAEYTAWEGRLSTSFKRENLQDSDDEIRPLFRKSTQPSVFTVQPPMVEASDNIRMTRRASSLPGFEAKSDNIESVLGTKDTPQEDTLDLTSNISRFIPLDHETTLTSSVGDSSQEQYISHHSSVTDDQGKIHWKDSSELADKQSKNGSPVESVTSMPDMAEILQRFGLDWAESMMRKMEKTERRSSSDSSQSQAS